MLYPKLIDKPYIFHVTTIFFMNSSKKTLITGIVLALICAALLFAGCTSQAPATEAEKVTLKVFNAGSLTAPFEDMEAAFEEEYSNVDVVLYAAGSTALAKEITELGKVADIYASADYTLIPSILMPADYADWYTTFAKNRMVICYTPQSKYAGEITADNWYEILAKDDIKWAFSDPNQDPCGYRTPMVIQLAEGYYGDDMIFDNVIGANSNFDTTTENGVTTVHVPGTEEFELDGTLSIRPKSVELVSMLQSGGLDYAWEYRSVAVQNELQFLELPEAIDLSSTDYKDEYATVKIDCVGGPQTGKPIVYGVTVPTNANQPDYGVEFVKMLIGPTGQAIMDAQGQPPVVPAGGFGSIPSQLSSLVEMKG